MSYLDGWRESTPNNLSAAEALAKAKANAAKIEEERRKKELEEQRIAESKQRCEDDVWFTQASDAAKLIIKDLIDNGKIGFKNAQSGWHNEKSEWEYYSFNNFVSDSAVESFKKHYNDLGYGCEVKTPRWPTSEDMRFGIYPANDLMSGHIVLWIPDPDELTEKENKTEISW